MHMFGLCFICWGGLTMRSSSVFRRTTNKTPSENRWELRLSPILEVFMRTWSSRVHLYGIRFCFFLGLQPRFQHFSTKSKQYIQQQPLGIATEPSSRSVHVHVLSRVHLFGRFFKSFCLATRFNILSLPTRFSSSAVRKIIKTPNKNHS